MSLVQLDIQTVVINSGFSSSMVVLRPVKQDDPDHPMRLPIRVGMFESSSIGMGVHTPKHGRPMTHDLLVNTITTLGGKIDSVVITKVEGTTFYSVIRITDEGGQMREVDARPSDAIALAVRAQVPVYASSEVMETAACPDFHEMDEQSKKREFKEFKDFVAELTPEDFSSGVNED